MRKIELLAPAKNLESGKAAINFGADAVYIGPESFGARKAAANSLSDIERLVRHAHLYHAKVFATINTILYEHELKKAQKLIHQLYSIGIDAIIIQDFGILEMDLPPVSIHLSTQTHNFDFERIKFVDQLGIDRIVLARELSLKQIQKIREFTKTELEYFVHGALCVSMSGQCYLSHYLGGRSANRGECAQPCRKAYDLLDSSRKPIEKKKHFLSPKDLNLSEHLQKLIDAGIGSLKIEGRLKDIQYVKNTVAYYRQKLDRILEGNSKLHKASSGKVVFDFSPDPERSFNRSFSTYFLEGRSETVGFKHSPKSQGKKTGKVLELKSTYFILKSEEKLANGDGLLFYNEKGEPVGIRANRVEGAKVFPLKMNGIYPGAILWRNADVAFEKKLEKSSAQRLIDCTIRIESNGDEVGLKMVDEDEVLTELKIECKLEKAKNPELNFQNIEQQLSKLGNTVYDAKSIVIHFSDSYFIPNKLLSEARRTLIELHSEKRLRAHERPNNALQKTTHAYSLKAIDYRHNVSNKLSEAFYQSHGVEEIEPAFELAFPKKEAVLMRTKLCVRYENQTCPRYFKSEQKNASPLYLRDENNGLLKLVFDCDVCEMKVIPAD